MSLTRPGISPVFADDAFVQLEERIAHRAMLDMNLFRRVDAQQGTCTTAAPANAPITTVEAIEQTIAKLDALKAQEKAEAKAAEAKAAKDALGSRLSYERGLANATVELLAEIARIEFNYGSASMSHGYAKYRKELSPLAETYGFKLVLVGDKSVAVLTR